MILKLETNLRVVRKRKPNFCFFTCNKKAKNFASFLKHYVYLVFMLVYLSTRIRRAFMPILVVVVFFMLKT